MAAFKNKDNGTWYVQFRYTDWRGERQQKLKRGFPTKKAALAWEREFLMKKQADLNMTLESFVELYTQRIKGEDVITCPKTKKSNRVIQMPQFLSDEIQDYIKQLYGVEHDSRLFPLSKHSMKSAMEKACKATSVKVIRLHDLRHSHVSLLIDMGFSALAIAERVGHESIDITYRYAHLFPTRQTEMAAKLNNERIKEGA